jgi:preprotein translocase subunit Sec61beta
MLGLFLFVWVLGSMTAAHAASAGILASGLLSAIRVLAGGTAIAALPPMWLIGIGLLVGAVVELARARKLGFV